MVYEDFKDLPRRTTSDKVLHDKLFNIAKNPKYDGYQREIAAMVYKLIHKTLLVVLLHVQINLLSEVKLRQSNN